MKISKTPLMPVIPKILEKHREYLESTYRLTNEITFSPGDTKPWESKLGGCLYLEDIDAYPKGSNGVPMIFLAQLNFDEMEPMPDFPKTGILQIFIAQDGSYGFDEPCFVKYIPKYEKDEVKLLRQNPYRSENYNEYEPFKNSGKINFTNKIVPIGTSCEEFESKFDDNDDISEDERDSLYDFCYPSGNKVGGYPYFVQQYPAYYEDGDYLLLLQLDMDVDDVCHFSFGDSGCCNFLILKGDLLNLDFSDVQYDMQCC